MKNKAFSKILVLIILIILTGGGIFAWQYFGSPKETEDETADWKTYRNEKYGFEIDYPSNLTTKDWAHQTPNWNLLVYIGENKDIGNGAVSVGIEKGVNKLEQISLFPFAVQIEDLEDVLIGQGNYQAKKFSYKGPAQEMSEEADFVNYFIKRSGYVYEIHYDKLGDLKENIFNQMLSTFKFTEQEESYIKVISPNDEEEWVIGNTYDITWKSKGVDKLGIDLTVPGQYNLAAHIATNISASLEKYSWKIEGVDLRDDYKITISSTEALLDESDNYFSIIKEDETANLNGCRTEYLDKIGKTEDFLIYHIKEMNKYRVFKCDLQTNKETELELLGHLDNTNVELSLSLNGEYIVKTSWSSPSVLPKIELMSFDNINKLTTLVEGEKDSFIQMIWSDDSSKIACWAVNRGSATYPSFKVYYLANITGAEPKLVKTYNDMTNQGFINLKQLISSENRLYLERTKLINGAPPVWEQDIIEL